MSHDFYPHSARSGLFTAVIAATLLLSISACGKKSPPVAPELTAPQAVKTVQASGSGTGVILKWNAPTSNASGDDLSDLRHFYVVRSLFIRGESPVFVRIADLDVSANTAPGAEFQYTDRTAVRGKTYDYQVVPVNADGIVSQDSKTVRVNFSGDQSVVEIF